MNRKQVGGSYPARRHSASPPDFRRRSIFGASCENVRPALVPRTESRTVRVRACLSSVRAFARRPVRVWLYVCLLALVFVFVSIGVFFVCVRACVCVCASVCMLRQLCLLLVVCVLLVLAFVHFSCVLGRVFVRVSFVFVWLYECARLGGHTDRGVSVQTVCMVSPMRVLLFTRKSGSAFLVRRANVASCFEKLGRQKLLQVGASRAILSIHAERLPRENRIARVPFGERGIPPSIPTKKCTFFFFARSLGRNKPQTRPRDH